MTRSIKREVESGETTVKTARIIGAIIITVAVGCFILGVSISAFFF